VLVAN
jgi:hypothetical protein